jgi:hypothetical protein
MNHTYFFTAFINQIITLKRTFDCKNEELQQQKLQTKQNSFNLMFHIILC